MDTTNSSENQQRRVEDRKPNETINWEAPDAPAVPLSPDAAERADPPVRYVASLLVNSEGASVFTTPDAARLPHGHYLLSAGAYSIAPGHAGRVERTPTGAYSQYVASCQDRGVLPCSRESFEADQASTSRPAATSGDAPADLQQLKALALAATPGEWAVMGDRIAPASHAARKIGGSTNRTQDRADYAHEICMVRGKCQPDAANAAYIAAANPAVVLDLIASIERAADPAPSGGTSEQQARYAIDGAIQYGRENRNPPPSEDHWLYEYWNIGRQLATLGATGWDNVTPMPATASGDELPEPAGREALRLLSVMFDKYENGVQCYEDPDECAGFMGTAVQLDAADECACVELLNKYAPKNEARAAVSAATKPAHQPESKLASFPLDEMAWDDKPDSKKVFGVYDWQLTLGDIRAAKRAATKPTADLSALTRFSASRKSLGAMVRDEDGSYFRVTDVQSLLATKPAAAPECLEHPDKIAAKITVKLRADSGYSADQEARISANQWGRICAILAGKGATPAASTTGAAQTAEQVRDQALEEAAQVVSAQTVPNAASAYNRAVGNCVKAVRALRPTPTHSSEAGDA